MRAVIQAIEYALPSAELPNEALARDFGDWSAEKIEEKTGIRMRHVVDASECASDLAVTAARRLFDSGIATPSEIDFVLLCTQSPDYFLPTTACVVQQRLGIPTTAGALDFNLGCSGFVYGLGLAKGLIETGQASRVLLLTADTYSKFINPRDRSVRTLFGDAAAATLIQASEGEAGIGVLDYGTDGRGAENLIVRTGGARSITRGDAAERQDENGNWRSDDDLYMNGPEIFNFTLRVVPRSINALLAKAGLSLESIDLFVFHQANRYMLDHLRKKMRIAEEKFAVHMSHCGNTVSSTIPIALKHEIDSRGIRPGSRVMLVGFGVGYSWASCLIDWP